MRSMDDGLREHDPYRGMRSAEDETRPDFLRNPRGVASGEQGSGENESASKVAVKNDRAAQDLVSAEEGASGVTPKNIADSVSGTRENEEEAGGFYSGSGKEKKQKLGRSGGIGFKGFIKKRAPIIAIFMTICGIGGAMFGAQSLLPFAISELLIEKFNSIGVSATIVSDEMLDLQLNQGIRQGAPDPSNKDTLFGLSEYQVQQFKINGIDAYNIEAGGTKGAVMLYKKNNRTATIPVVGSTMLGAAKTKQIKDGIAKASGLDFASIKDPVGVKDALDDKDFYVPYTSASKVWRNGTSSWFDKIMKNVTEAKLGITRSRWASFVARKITDIDADFKEKFNKTAAGTKKVDDNGGVVRGEMQDVEKEVVDAETGETKRITDSEYVDVDSNKDKISGDSLPDSGSAKLSDSTGMERVKDVLNSKAVRAAQAAGNTVCALADAAVVIYTTVQAYQGLQFLNLVTGFLEAVDRVKAGDGDTSPVMEYTANLTTVGNTVDGTGETLKDSNKKAVKRTAIASAGMSWLFGNTKINSDDPSVKNTNFESVMSKLTGITSDYSTFSKILEGCGYFRIASSVVDLTVDMIMLVGTLGAGNVVGFFVKKIFGAAIAIGVGVVVSAILSETIHGIAKLIMKNAATEWFGEDLGNAMISGAGRYLGGNGTSGGQGPGTRESVVAYLVAQQGVIAKEAEYQRAIRSPFDATSQYTFLGSLVYSLMPLAFSGGGIMSFLKDAASTTSNSIVAMLPTVNAIETNNDLSSVGECNILDGAGIVGDAYCNPYIITDVNTSNLIATDVYNTVARGFGGEVASAGRSYIGGGNIDDNGQIVDNSSLSKYVTYCGQRTSQYNLYDASIAGRITGSSSRSKILDYLPGASEVISIMDNTAIVDNIDWINGMECVVGGTHWGENKYYQRYTENERLLEGMNPNYTSPVTAYLEDYYKENPLDTSFEGTLARFSGQTKEDVELALDLIEYYDYIENYNPETRYAFIEKEESEPIYYESDTRFAVISDALVLTPLRIVYADLRGRYYTV